MTTPEQTIQPDVLLRIPGTRSTGHSRSRIGQIGLTTYGGLGSLFFYVPIVVLVVFSFNNSRLTARRSWFTLSSYGEMQADDQVILALWNSLFVAIVAPINSPLLGTLAAMGKERQIIRGKLPMDALLYLPIVIPDIAMAILLLLISNLSGFGVSPWRIEIATLRLSVPHSVIIGHVAFNISFVAIVVRARLSQMEQALEEAAQDLYTDSWRTF